MSRLRRINHLCSRTVSDPANGLLKRTDSEGSSSVAEKKSSAVPLFRSGHCRQFAPDYQQGKGGVHKRMETAGCLPLVRPRGVSVLPAAVREKHPARQGRTRRRSSYPPVSRCWKRVPARQERTRCGSSSTPLGRCRERVPPGQGEHANAVRVPRSAGAEKAAAPFGRTACAVRVSRLTLRSYLTILREQSMLSQQQNRRKYEPVHPCTLRSVPRH